MDPNIISALRLISQGLQALAEALESGQVGVPDPPNLTVKDAAALLNCDPCTVRSAVHREGDPMPAVKIGTLLRFRRSEVLEWASRQRPKDRPYVEDPAPRKVLPVSGGIRKAKRRTDKK
jgi:excisionase family DNA binding protein